MAINKESNGYTFAFAISLVVVVGTLLVIIASWAKPFKDANDEVKKKMDIVKAIEGFGSRSGAVSKPVQMKSVVIED